MIQTNYLDNASDKLWRLTHFYKIRNKKKELTLLKPNNIQLMMYESIKDKKILREFFLKYRQGGVSTFWLLWWLDDTIFNENTITGVLSHTRESLKYLWEIIRIGFNNMPSEFKPKVSKFNETTLSFENLNSTMFVSLNIRSTAVHNLHISEICHIDSDEIRATLGSISPRSNVTIESTANGIGNDGYLIYQDAKLGKNQFHPMFFPWYYQNEYRIDPMGMEIIRDNEEKKLNLDDSQILWRRYKISEEKNLFQQEFPEDDEKAFLTSGNSYFDNKKISILLKEANIFDKENSVRTNYEYYVWKEPNKYHVYVAGADVAEGINGDYSVLTIMDVTTDEQVFRWRGHIGVDGFYKICDKWCRYYNKALLAVERNNHGHAVILGLYEIMKYPNLYVQDIETRIVTKHGYKDKKEIMKIGWDTNSNTKVLMLDQLKQAIEGNYLEDESNFTPNFKIYDIVFLQECLTFKQDGTKISSQVGSFDDTVIAWAICFQMYLRVKGKLNRSSTPNIFEQEIFIGEKLQSSAII